MIGIEALMQAGVNVSPSVIYVDSAHQTNPLSKFWDRFYGSGSSIIILFE